MSAGRRGVTLTELIVVMSLVLIAAAIGFASMQAIRGRSGLRSIALRLLADLRWAREEAMAGHGPAGVLLPTSSASQSYAVVLPDADAPGAMVADRVCRWAEEEGDVVVANGTWAGLTFVPDSPPFAGRVDFGGRLDAAAVEQVKKWSVDYDGRWVMFGSNGAVVSNLPHAGGDRFLVVAAGTQSQGGAITEAGQGYTIRIRPAGEMALEEGMPGRTLRPGSIPPTDVGTLPALRRPRQDRGPNRPPVVEQFDVAPAPNADMLPPGAVAGRTFQLRADGSLSLTVTASDPDDDQLSCSWAGDAPTSQPLDDPAPTPPDDTRCDSGTAPEGYSVSSPQVMTREGSTFTSTVEWTPPASATPGEWYALGVMVDDMRGGRDARWIVVQLIERGAIRLGSSRMLTRSECVAAVADLNGGELTNVPFGGTWEQEPPRFTPDGRVLYVSYDANSRTVWHLVADDLQDFQVVNPPDSTAISIFDVSPDGVNLLWRSPDRTNFPVSTAWLTHLDGSDAQSLGSDFVHCQFTPAGRIAAIVSQATGGCAVVLIDPASGDRTVIDPSVQDGGTYQFFSFAAGGSRLIYDAGTDSGTHSWHVAEETAGTWTIVPLTVGDEDRAPTWSPDGSRVAWVRGSQLMVARYAGALAEEQALGTAVPRITWLDDRRLAAPRTGRVYLDLFRFEAGGGQEKMLVPNGSTSRLLSPR